MYEKIIKKYINDHNFIASKKLGQNFLINDHICQSIVNSINFIGVDLIIEVGPGLGSLTHLLLQKKIDYIGIELDKRLCSFCNEQFKTNPHGKFINDDALQVNFKKIITGYKNPIIVSNLPYVITSPFIFKFINDEKIKYAYLMLQKEIIEKLTSKPNSKQWNGFTLTVNSYCSIKKILDVGKNNFLPVPQINSGAIEIIRNSKKFNQQYVDFIKTMFGAKRKTIINNLQKVFDKEKIIVALNKQNISITTRGEQLSVTQLELLFNELIH